MEEYIKELCNIDVVSDRCSWKMAKRFEIQLTEMQHKLLEARSTTAGFRRMSEYVRYILFADSNIVDKIFETYYSIF